MNRQLVNAYASNGIVATLDQFDALLSQPLRVVEAVEIAEPKQVAKPAPKKRKHTIWVCGRCGKSTCPNAKNKDLRVRQEDYNP